MDWRTAQRKFEREKTARIAFLGGSITAGGGWRDHAMKYFQAKFPQTKFEFIAAGHRLDGLRAACVSAGARCVVERGRSICSLSRRR
jgi:hypothetical protein